MEDLSGFSPILVVRALPGSKPILFFRSTSGVRANLGVPSNPGVGSKSIVKVQILLARGAGYDEDPNLLCSRSMGKANNRLKLTAPAVTPLAMCRWRWQASCPRPAA